MQEDLLSNAPLIDVPAVLALFASASRGYRRAIDWLQVLVYTGTVFQFVHIDQTLASNSLVVQLAQRSKHGANPPRQVAGAPAPQRLFLFLFLYFYFFIYIFFLSFSLCMLPL